MTDIRNDSDLSTEDALALLEKDGVRLTYGSMIMMVQRGALEEARIAVASWTSEERQRASISVDRTLRKNLPKMERGRFSRRVANDFHADILLWTALQGTRS